MCVSPFVYGVCMCVHRCLCLRVFICVKLILYYLCMLWYTVLNVCIRSCLEVSTMNYSDVTLRRHAAVVWHASNIASPHLHDASILHMKVQSRFRALITPR